MKIISHFHDFYDSVMKFGTDQTLIYSRLTDEIKLEKPSDNIKYIISVNSNYYRRPHELKFEYNNWGIDGYKQKEISMIARPIVIGFCGKIYKIIRLRINDRKTYTITNTNELISIIRKYKRTERFIKSFEGEVKRKRNSWQFFGGSGFTRENISRFFDKYSNSEHPEIFYEYNCPIFMIRGDKLTVNPNLSKVEFYKIIPAYTAFQELSMYIPGVLGVGEPDMASISDIDMRDKKGFDDMSFKNMSPGEKKARRKENRKRKRENLDDKRSKSSSTS